MGLKDILARLLGSAQDYAAKNPDRVSGALDKAARTVDERTGGKYSDKIEQGRGQADKLIRRPDGGQSGPTPGTGSPEPGPQPDPDAPRPGSPPPR